MEHGGDLTDAVARFGAGDPPWLDLSTGINPHPWPIPPGLREAGWTRLPSRADGERLLAAARAAYRVPDEAAIVAAPGTQALIQWLPRLAPPGPVAVLGPTYAEHAAAWRLAGFPVREIASPGDIGDAAHLVLVRPNNPDGALPARGAVAEAARVCWARGGFVVIDESFADLVPDASLADLAAEGAAIVLRSFGKFYGLAGLRLGFALAPKPIGRRIADALGPWSVSGPALAIGAAALADRDWAERMRGKLAREAEALDAALTAGGLVPAGGTDLYRLVRHADAASLHEALARAHIWVRRFADAPDRLRFGLPPDPSGLARLADALAAHAQGTRTGRPSCSAR